MSPTMEHSRILYIGITIGSILLVPLIAMQFTNEVNWDIFDFLVAAILLSTVGFFLELIARRAGDARRRIIYTALLLFIFMYVWAELAVGIFNIPGISGN